MAAKILGLGTERAPTSILALAFAVLAGLVVYLLAAQMLKLQEWEEIRSRIAARLGR